MHGDARMQRRVLITGGAGFIGSHVADALIARGDRVRVLDALLPQVHGSDRRRPAYLSADVELVEGDVRDPAAVKRALASIDVVYHFASRVGVGQSMYELADYTSVNNLGTAVLLEALIATPVQRLVVASSMSVYGEGLYRDSRGRLHDRVQRTPDQIAGGRWDPRAEDGSELAPVPTPETKPPLLASLYALSKHDQERMCLMVGAAYKIPTVALRFFNVYGPRQALSNPYTGVLAIFAARLLNGRPPLLFEDGRQQRDFVHARDAANACLLALDVEEAAGRAFNIASGRAMTIREVAERMAGILERNLAPHVTGQHRVGDIRHCTADLSLARRVLGFAPQVDFDRGMRELAVWLEAQSAVDRFEHMRAELADRGLAV
ncbi:MAG: NAD-dependent epimerase/dehydratase family protein [Deltaproteobacteria bacterium]|nr:NAD-dependent epimerase/dehydratase family protein [Deltaproteobacteria bacterium]